MIIPSDQVPPGDFAEFARAVCDRNFGVGSDGCIFVVRVGRDDAEVRIFNQDGSEAGMSGNGTRCACAYLHHRGGLEHAEVVIHTRSGAKRFALLESEEDTWKYRTCMGRPVFEAAAIPFKGAADVEEIIEQTLMVAGDSLKVTALSVGNPQCVVFVNDLPGEVNFRKWGSGLEHHPAFPERTNVSFAKVEGIHGLRARIWERGVGPTFSSGTGTSAAGAAALRTGRVKSPVEVDTDTGRQIVEWDGAGDLFLTGEAVFVAEVRFRRP